MKNLLEHMGVEPGRVQFSWISSAESTKYVAVAKEVIEKIKELGPNERFAKYRAKVA